MKQHASPVRQIVVGVDGSLSSKAVLRWALRQAELTGSAIRAVIAWPYPAMVGGYAPAPVSLMDSNDSEDIAAKQLSETIAEVVDPVSSGQIGTRCRKAMRPRHNWAGDQ